MPGHTAARENYHIIPIEPDDAFEAISNCRRRRVLLSLDHSGSPIEAGALAAELAAIENRVEPRTVTSEQRSRVYIALTQVHLDTLHEIGAVNYDSQSKQVAPTDATAGLAEVIRRTESSCYLPEVEHGGEVDA